jgi:hypothetical protein
MQNDKFSSPFPCVVYTKRPSTGEYVFSHYCNTRVPKSMPRSMRVAHMQEFAQTPKFSTTLSKSVFLVLVAGDVAQCITATNTGEKRTRFLYRGSTYSRPPACTPPPCSDFNRDYIPLHFFSSLTTFLKGTPVGVTHLEAGISLFPRSIRDHTGQMGGPQYRKNGPQQRLDHGRPSMLQRAYACTPRKDTLAYSTDLSDLLVNTQPTRICFHTK